MPNQITFLYPISSAPSKEDMRVKNLLIFEVEFDDATPRVVAHNLNMPPGLDPYVTITKTQDHGGNNQTGLLCEFTDSNTVTLTPTNVSGGHWRVYIDRMVDPLI
jgi:hypothetical protein